MAKIHVEGDHVWQIKQALGIGEGRAEIKITLNLSHTDYARNPAPGCVVDATNYTEKVPREFASADDAIRYIASLLKMHDKHAARRDAEEKAKARSDHAKEKIRAQIARLQKMLEKA